MPFMCLDSAQKGKPAQTKSHPSSQHHASLLQTPQPMSQNPLPEYPPVRTNWAIKIRIIAPSQYPIKSSWIEVRVNLSRDVCLCTRAANIPPSHVVVVSYATDLFCLLAELLSIKSILLLLDNRVSPGITRRSARGLATGRIARPVVT